MPLISFCIIDVSVGIVKIEKVGSFLGEENSFESIHIRISNRRRRKSSNPSRIVRIFFIRKILHNHRRSAVYIRLLEMITQGNICFYLHSSLEPVVENSCDRRLVFRIFFLFFHDRCQDNHLIGS